MVYPNSFYKNINSNWSISEAIANLGLPKIKWNWIVLPQFQADLK